MLVTEQINSNTAEIDRLPTLEALQIINSEDRKVATAIELVLPEVARAVQGIVERIKDGGHLYYVGTGTSGRLGVLDAAECPPTFGVSPQLVQGLIAGGYDACFKAVEASEDDRQAGAEDLRARRITEKDAVVGIAASGRTPYTIGALEYARSIGALTICISCNKETEIASVVEIPIEAIVGPEVIAGSTRLKAGTAQKMILNMISTMTMVRMGYVTGNRMTNLTPRNEKLRNRALEIVMHECALESTAAMELLVSAKWDLRLALVMQKANVEREPAEAALKKANFAISKAIDLLRTAAS